MKPLTFIIVFILFFFNLISCSNNQELKESKEKDAFTTKKFKTAKIENQKKIDSLSKEILSLEKSKSKLYSKNKKSLIENTLKQIIVNSNFDHIILGEKNNSISNLFNKKLGFNIVKGTNHKNGIKNRFIEFNNSTEIEFISVKSPKDKLSQKYYNTISKNISVLNTAFRTENIKELKNVLNEFDSTQNSFYESDFYSTLIADKLYNYFPTFFIQYNKHNLNKETNHSNGSIGISSLWYSVKNISESALHFANLGFNPIGLVEFPTIERKCLLLRNNYFEIILMESETNRISGITIDVVDYTIVKDNLILNQPVSDYNIENRGKSILLSPSLTKSIWIEFLERTN